MSFWTQPVSSTFQRTCCRKSLARLYSTDVSSVARKKWGVVGTPRPLSILEDDDAEVDLSEDNEAVNGSRPNTLPPHLRSPPEKATPQQWKAHRETIRKRFPDGWSPPRTISREAMDGLRLLYKLDSEKFNASMLAEKFRISPEAVRRILKSKWEPSREKKTKLALKERKEKQDTLRLSQLKEQMEAAALIQKPSKGRGKDGLTLT